MTGNAEVLALRQRQQQHSNHLKKAQININIILDASKLENPCYKVRMVRCKTFHFNSIFIQFAYRTTVAPVQVLFWSFLLNFFIPFFLRIDHFNLPSLPLSLYACHLRHTYTYIQIHKYSQITRYIFKQKNTGLSKFLIWCYVFVYPAIAIVSL